MVIVAIFDSAFDLGNNYIDNVVGELDHHIDAVLDYGCVIGGTFDMTLKRLISLKWVLHHKFYVELPN